MNPEGPSEIVKCPVIAAEIAQMYEADQAKRKRWEQQKRNVISEEDVALDEKNTERMKEIVSEIGWPTASKVGKEGAHHAWLLVQHADHDVDFQLHCLELMKEASANEVDKTDIAYLEDRVRVNQGRGQLYGTQFMQKNNQHIPRPIEDEKNVDKRRSEVGMGPLQEQIDHMYAQYPPDD